MERKSEQRKRDEDAMRYAGFLGHTFFEVADDETQPGKSRLRSQCSTIWSAIRGRDENSRIYQKVGKGKYRLVG